MTKAPPPPINKIPVAPMRTPPPATGPTKITKRLTNTEASAPCPRIVLYGVEKWGKTTVAAYSPDPVILMARGEQGYRTLLSAHRAPSVPSELINSWPEAIAWLDSLIEDPQGRKSVWLDALGGFEQLCREFICAKEFDGDWGEKGFEGFKRGYALVGTEFLRLLQRLDELHDKHGIITGIIGHAKAKVFNDPTGPAYDRYACDAHDAVWNGVARWSDCILFGKFYSIVNVANTKDNLAKQKGKGIGGTQRVIYTEQRDALVAGNRYGMMPEFQMPEDPAQGWATLWNEITRDKTATE